jgi:hypothetical protein
MTHALVFVRLPQFRHPPGPQARGPSRVSYRGLGSLGGSCLALRARAYLLHSKKPPAAPYRNSQMCA